MKSINDIGKKRGRGRPATDATPVLVRMPPDVLKALDAWISQQSDAVTRPNAIRRLVEIGLAGPAAGRTKKSATSSKSSELAATQLDKLADTSAPPSEQATRKQQLLKGPSEFRDVRLDRKNKL